MGQLQKAAACQRQKVKNKVKFRKSFNCEIQVFPIQYQKDFVFLSHNLGKLPRKYEKLNSGLREQVKQKNRIAF